jgi:hypothetical protein
MGELSLIDFIEVLHSVSELSVEEDSDPFRLDAEFDDICTGEKLSQRRVGDGIIF